MVKVLVLNIVLLLAAWFVGMILYSFGAMQIILTLNVAVPLTKELDILVLIDAHTAKKAHRMTIGLWLTIIAAVVALLLLWGNPYVLTGAAIGFIMAFFFSLGKWGMLTSNKEDFLKSHFRYIPEDKRNLAVVIILADELAAAADKEV